MGVGADLEPDPVLALVHEDVHVAHDRELDRARRFLEPRHRADVDHLMHGRGERDVRAGHRREQRAPDAAGDHDHLGLDHATRGVDAPDPAVLDVHPADVGVREHLQAARLDPPLAHDRARAQGVDDGDRRAVEAAEQDRLVDVGHELLDLGRSHEPRRVDAPRLRRRHPAAELLHPLLGARDLDPAALGVDAHLDVLPLRLERELRHLLRVVDREDEVRGVAGRAAGVGQRALVDLDDVRPAEPGQVVGEAVADDAAADHDGPGARWEVAHGISCSCARGQCRGSEDGADRALEGFDVVAHDGLGALGVAVADRLQELAVLGDGVVEPRDAVEREEPDPQGEGVVLVQGRLDVRVVGAAVDVAVDALVELDQRPLVAGRPPRRAAPRAASGRSRGRRRSRARAASRAAKLSRVQPRLGEGAEIADVDRRDDDARGGGRPRRASPGRACAAPRAPACGRARAAPSARAR